MNRIFEISSAAQAAEALAEGAAWLHLTDPAALDEVIPPCRDADAILTLRGNPARVMETKIHGLIVDPASDDPDAVREYLGPHAILGVEVPDLPTLLRYCPQDVDFFVLTAPTEACGEIIARAREKGVAQRIIARCECPGADGIIG